MPYIIDGHNLISKIPGIELSNIDDEIELIRRMQSFARQSGKRVEVYFDKAPPGQARRQNYGKVTAFFVREGRTADDAILARLRALGGNARNWSVVSSDREVRRGAQACQARVVSSQAFAGRLSATSSSSGKKSDLKVDEDEVAYWLNQFEKG